LLFPSREACSFIVGNRRSLAHHYRKTAKRCVPKSSSCANRWAHDELPLCRAPREKHTVKEKHTTISSFAVRQNKSTRRSTTLSCAKTRAHGEKPDRRPPPRGRLRRTLRPSRHDHDLVGRCSSRRVPTPSHSKATGRRVLPSQQTTKLLFVVCLQATHDENEPKNFKSPL
jgi:hypothetical protein